MAWPSGLPFTNRRARSKSRWFFLCARDHGQPGGKRSPLRKAFKTESDREYFAGRHDALFHSDVLHDVREHLGVVPVEAGHCVLGELVDAYLAHLAENVAAGMRKQKSVEYYERLTPRLVEGFGADFDVRRITKDLLRRYISWRRKTGSTQGASIIKELKALQTFCRWAEIPFGWKVPFDEIRPKKAAAIHPGKVEVTPAIIERLIAAMKPDSLEYAVAVTKLLTAMRTVELRELRVKNVDLKKREIRFTLHAKRFEYAHVIHVTPELAAVLRARIVGRGPEEYVFVIGGDGRPLLEQTLRHRLRMASKRAKPPIDPPIESLSHLRHEAITAAVKALSLEETARGTGHRNVETIEGHYLQRRYSDPAAAKVFAEAVRDAFKSVLHGPVN